MNVVDQKYVSLLTYKLDKFRKVNRTLFNFRCPVCGDSEKNKNKARGYIYENKGALWFHCHNCNAHKSFKNFLYEVDQVLYHEYILERLKKEHEEKMVEEPVVSKRYGNVFHDLKNINQLEDTHIARKYVLERRLPIGYYDDLYYCEDYKTFVNNLIPEKIKYDDVPRLVIPHYDTNRDVIGFQGRALLESKVRYSTVHLIEDRPLVFGLDRVDFNRKYYVVEGAIDSMFIPNSIAASSSGLVPLVKKLGVNQDNAVLVFDNEPRNAEIVKNINAAIINHYNVVIWPSDVNEKDINSMVIAGRNPVELIDKNTCKDLEAKLEFEYWKKV